MEKVEGGAGKKEGGKGRRREKEGGGVVGELQLYWCSTGKRWAKKGMEERNSHMKDGRGWKGQKWRKQGSGYFFFNEIRVHYDRNLQGKGRDIYRERGW